MLFLSYCCVVSTSHAINVVCTVSPVGAAWCRHSTCSQKSLPGTSLFTCDQITLMKNKAPPPRTLRLGSLLSESPSCFFLFVVLRYPLPRLRYARRDGPSSGLFRHALFFPSSSSSSSSFYWNVLSLLFLFVLLPPFSLVCLTRTFLLWFNEENKMEAREISFVWKIKEEEDYSAQLVGWELEWVSI